MSVELRVATESDLAWLWDGIVDINRIQKEDVVLTEQDKSEVYEANRASVASKSCIVAWIGDQRCGFLSWIHGKNAPFVPNENDTLWWHEFDFITYIYVSNEHRRLGVAKAMLDRMLGLSKQRYIYLDIFENNLASQRFFASVGARVMAHVSEKLFDVTELQQKQTELLMHSSDGSFARLQTPARDGLFTRAFDARDMPVVRTALRAIFASEGVDLAAQYGGEDEEHEAASFAHHYAPHTLVCVDATSDRVVGLVTARKTNLCPFGVDYGQFYDAEVYLYISWAWTAEDYGRRGIAARLLHEQIAWNALRWVRSSFVSANKQSVEWHRRMVLTGDCVY